MIGNPGRRLHAVALAVLLTMPGCATSGSDSPSDVVVIDGVTVTAPKNDIVITETVQLQASVTPSGVPQGVTWTTSDADIATVDASGLVTGVRTGSVTITATSTADATRKGSVTIAVACPDPRMVTADISGDTTWENWLLDPVCFDYQVSTDLDFNSGVLTIQPGTVVGFEAGHRMAVKRDAGLNAAGLVDNPILLTGTQPKRGHWNGILFDNTDNPANVLRYTTIEYAGPAAYGQGIQAAGLMIDGTATVTLEHSTVRESSTFGLFLQAGAQVLGSGGNTFTANALGAAYAHASVTHFLGAGASVLSGNDVDWVSVKPDGVDESVTWAAIVDPATTAVDGYYRILQQNARDAFTVRGALTLEPGVVIAFEEDMAMVVRSGGALSAVGTADMPILLTGADAVPGHWRGLGFTDTDNAMNRLDHVTVEYGGREVIGIGEPASLLVTSNSSVPGRVTVSNTTLRGSTGYGLYVRAGSTVDDFTGNTLTQNALGPAYVGAPVVDQLLESNGFVGNAADFVTVQAGGGINTVADTVTWRDLGVPYRLVTLGGNELVVRGRMLVEPGAEIRFADDMGLSVLDGAYLGAVGTAEDQVVFRGDGAPWKGVHVDDSQAYFDQVAFEDAGSSVWSGAAVAGAVTVTTGDSPSKVTFTPNVSSSGADYGVVFTLGDTFGSGCLAPTYIPPPDEYVDHCNPAGTVLPPAPPAWQGR